jgi:hypothetical protein
MMRHWPMGRAYHPHAPRLWAPVVLLHGFTETAESSQEAGYVDRFYVKPRRRP